MADDTGVLVGGRLQAGGFWSDEQATRRWALETAIKTSAAAATVSARDIVVFAAAFERYVLDGKVAGETK